MVTSHFNIMENINLLENFTIDALEEKRRDIIRRDDAENAKRIMESIENAIKHNNHREYFRWPCVIRPNNIALLKKNGFEIWKVTINYKQANRPFTNIIYYISTTKGGNIEELYKEDVKSCEANFKVCSGNLEKL